MRFAGPSLSLSLLLFAAPALAQGGGYYDSGNPYNRQQMNQNRYEYNPPQQDQTWHYPARQGQWQQGQMQSEPMQDMMQRHQRMMQQSQQGSGYPQSQMAMGQANPGTVSSSTQGQIRQSLESSGFKNVTVVPQSFLIRATAPDGSRVLMQVSPDSLSGVVVSAANQGGSSTTGSGTANMGGKGSASSSTGGTSGTGSASSSTGGTSGTGNTSNSTGSASNTGGTTGTGGASTTGNSGPSTSTGGTSGSSSGSAETGSTGSASSGGGSR
ncbi:MAG: hypothetical protein AB7H71_11425 [Alphaproteobacteria bacterium]